MHSSGITSAVFMLAKTEAEKPLPIFVDDGGMEIWFNHYLTLTPGREMTNSMEIDPFCFNAINVQLTISTQQLDKDHESKIAFFKQSENIGVINIAYSKALLKYLANKLRIAECTYMTAIFTVPLYYAQEFFNADTTLDRIAKICVHYVQPDRVSEKIYFRDLRNHQQDIYSQYDISESYATLPSVNFRNSRSYYSHELEQIRDMLDLPNTKNFTTLSRIDYENWHNTFTTKLPKIVLPMAENLSSFPYLRKDLLSYYIRPQTNN